MHVRQNGPRWARHWWLLALTLALATACDRDDISSSDLPDSAPVTTGGTMDMGGGPAPGGTVDMGGQPTMGGEPAMGGAQNMGGEPGMGGAQNMGGEPGMGGAQNMGGEPGMGGAQNMGGEPGPRSYQLHSLRVTPFSVAPAPDGALRGRVGTDALSGAPAAGGRFKLQWIRAEVSEP